MPNTPVPAAATGLPNRRIFLAAGPAALVFGSLKAAAAETDPIFAAIRAHEVAEIIWFEIEEQNEFLSDEPGYAQAQTVLARARAAYQAEYDKLVSTPPQTVAGLLAYVGWMARYFNGRLVNEDAADNLFNSPVLTTSAA